MSEDDYKYAKYGDTWMVFDHYLTVKEWRPNFNSSDDDDTSLTIRGRFALMCVDVDLTKTMLAKYKLRRKV